MCAFDRLTLVLVKSHSIVIAVRFVCIDRGIWKSETTKVEVERFCGRNVLSFPFVATDLAGYRKASYTY